MWTQIREDRWERLDGCVVKIDEHDSAAIWKPHHRSWIAFGPGDDDFNYLGFKRRNSGFNIPRKFKTPESAMKAVDKQYPFKEGCR